MDREELYRKLREYTPQEERLLRGEISPRKAAACGHAGGEEMLKLQMNEFIGPGENIGIHRQDRFCGVDPHTHDYIELVYVWSGSCIQRIEGQSQKSREGDVCIFDTQAVHSFGVTGEGDLVINILMRREFFDSAFLTRLAGQGILSEFLVDSVTRSRKKRHYLYFRTHENKRVRRIMEDILTEYYGQDLGSGQVIESCMVILFTELLRSMRDSSGAGDSRERADICEILAYVEKHYQTCTLTEVAEHFGFNSRYLSGLIKERTGKSFLEHVQEQRLKKACALLRDTDLPVQEVVGMCGYANVNFFYKKFRQAFHCRPGDFRRSAASAPPPGQAQEGNLKFGQ